ncbi:MAG: ribbon-helix-helix protein, CopG family [Gammaproteobacteria bacterium]|nr:ribbon-helix-helix protein, CopG family [Gammaproteobacteria bacterium]
MNVRSTFALDEATAKGLADLAKRWKVSKSQALRRAVAQAQEQPGRHGEMTPQEALERLAERPPLDKEDADAWIAANRDARRASDARRARAR